MHFPFFSTPRQGVPEGKERVHLFTESCRILACDFRLFVRWFVCSDRLRKPWGPPFPNSNATLHCTLKSGQPKHFVTKHHHCLTQSSSSSSSSSPSSSLQLFSLSLFLSFSLSLPPSLPLRSFVVSFPRVLYVPYPLHRCVVGSLPFPVSFAVCCFSLGFKPFSSAHLNASDAVRDAP